MICTTPGACPAAPALTPLDANLNSASAYIASHIFPLGFDVRRAAPNTFDDLHSALDVYGRMAIWSGDYSNSVFADTETWWQFRAWHDWVHYRFDCGFEMQGEHAACHVQAGQLMRLYGRTDDVARMIALVFCTVVSPLEEQLAGRPVEDVYAFCRDTLEDWLGYAKQITERQGRTDQDALEFAKQAYLLRDTVGPRVDWKARPASASFHGPAPVPHYFESRPSTFERGDLRTPGGLYSAPEPVS